MKGLITAAGLGTRSGLNGKIRKEMLPMYELLDGEIVLRPMLDIIYRRMRSLGIDDVIIVLNPEDTITMDYVKRNLGDAVVVYQERPSGYGNAVLRAKEAVGGDDVLLNAGDGLLLDANIAKSVLRKNAGESIDLFLFRVRDPSRYGVATVYPGSDRNVDLEESSPSTVSFAHSDHLARVPVAGVEEKPSHPKSDLALCATYILPNAIFEALEAYGKAEELTPAIDLVIKNGTRAFGTVLPAHQWISVGRAEKYVEVLSRSLEWARSV